MGMLDSEEMGYIPSALLEMHIRSNDLSLAPPNGHKYSIYTRDVIAHF